MKSRAIVRNEVMYSGDHTNFTESHATLRRILRSFLRTRVEVAARAVVSLEPKRLLDFGCGQGGLLSSVIGMSHIHGFECTGIDIVQSNILQARAKFKLIAEKEIRYRFIRGDEKTLDRLPASFYDVITCIAVFELIEDVYGLAKSLKRLLRPQGHLVIEFTNVAYIRKRLRLSFGKLPVTTPIPFDIWPLVGWDGSILHYYTRETALAFLRQNDFEVESVEPTGLLSNFALFPGLFATGFVFICRNRS